jgi:thioredoxin 1
MLPQIPLHHHPNKSRSSVYNTLISLHPSKPPLPPFPLPPLKYPESIFLKVIGDSSSSASSLMKRESVRTVPAFHFFKDGVKVDVVNGANADALEQAIKKHT